MITTCERTRQRPRLPACISLVVGARIHTVHTISRIEYGTNQRPRLLAGNRATPSLMSVTGVTCKRHLTFLSLPPTVSSFHVGLDPCRWKRLSGLGAFCACTNWLVGETNGRSAECAKLYTPLHRRYRRYRRFTAPSCTLYWTWIRRIHTEQEGK